MTMADLTPGVRNLSFAQGYSVRDVAGLLGLSPTQIRGFVRSGLLAPARGLRREFRFTFQDVLLLKTAKGLLDAHVPQRRARRALRKLRTALHGERSLTAVRIEAAGGNVVVREDDRAWDAESGQGHFVFSARQLICEVSSLIEPGHLFDDLDPEMTSDEWYNLGLDLEEISPIDALHAYQRAVGLEPTNADAHVNRGRLEQMRGDIDAAAEAYRQALAHAPAHELAYYNLGTVHDERGEVAEAMDCYRRAPGVADAHYNLARLYEITGDEFSALRHLRRSQQIEAERGRP
jgi:tetratricopeptide (TPR) repeat protein